MTRTKPHDLPLAGVLILLAGCVGCGPVPDARTARRPILTEHGGPGPARGDASPREWFVYLADGLPKARRLEVRDTLGAMALSGPEGDVIHVIRTPDHALLASWTLAGPPGRDRLRDPTMAAALAVIDQFCRDDSVVPDHSREQLQVPRLVESFWAYRATDLPPRIVLVGTPVFHDPEAPEWSFRDFRYPSPSTIEAEDSASPFRNRGRARLPQDAQITWLVSGAEWGDSQLHRDHVLAFYRHAFASQLGGELVRIGTAVPAAFERVAATAFPPLEIPEDPLPPRMLVVPGPARAPEWTTGPAGEPPAGIREEIERVTGSPHEILIAISWTSERPDTDVDLRITRAGHPGELNYRSMTTTFGRLVRDVVRTGRGRADDSDFRSWEMAVIDHDRVEDLTIWLNAFAASGPIEVRVLTVEGGRQYVHDLTFPVERGDGGLGHSRRHASPAWTQLLPSQLVASRVR